jgi:hypothetical protein
MGADAQGHGLEEHLTLRDWLKGTGYRVPGSGYRVLGSGYDDTRTFSSFFTRNQVPLGK